MLVDVTGEEFESFMDLASKLQYISTPEGGQEMAKLVSDQAELGVEFQVTILVSRKSLSSRYQSAFLYFILLK